MASDSTSIKGIDVVTYLVKDVDRALKFYRDAMGLKVSQEYHGQGAEFTLGDGATFGIYKMHDDTWQASGGVMFAVDDAKAAVDLYCSRGVEFMGEGEELVNETPVCFMAFGKDSEGNNFILHQRKT